MNDFNTRSLPRKPGRPQKRVPIVRNPNGVNEGGNCLGCSNQVRYWYNYCICDHCLTIPTGAITRDSSAGIDGPTIRRMNGHYTTERKTA